MESSKWFVKIENFKYNILIKKPTFYIMKIEKKNIYICNLPI